MSAVTHLLYLNGFRSSPKSFKAQRMAAWCREHRPDLCWWCPQLPPSPRGAIDLVERGIEPWPRGTTSRAERGAMAVIGSSLGGFYATVVAERTGCRAVLLNPAVHPARDLAGYVGEQTAWHDPDDHFFFKTEFVGELERLTPTAINRPERYLAVIAKGDEVLDWREMQSRYAACNVKLLEGGDHALSDFDDHLPDIVRFLELDRT